MTQLEKPRIRIGLHWRRKATGEHQFRVYSVNGYGYLFWNSVSNRFGYNLDFNYRSNRN